MQMASEKELRKVSEKQIGDNIKAEAAPLCFPTKHGFDICLAPLVYVPDLIGKIIQMLEQNFR